MTMPLMTVEEVERVVDCWITETRLLSHQFGYVQLFENRGELMGCSNAHPHCQIWASSFVPSEVLRENRQQLQYYEQNGRLLLQDYVQHELQVPANESRVVLQNEEWVVVVSAVRDSEFMPHGDRFANCRCRSGLFGLSKRCCCRRTSSTRCQK